MKWNFWESQERFKKRNGSNKRQESFIRNNCSFGVLCSYSLVYLFLSIILIGINKNKINGEIQSEIINWEWKKRGQILKKL